MELQLGTDHDDASARVVDPLAQQVLAEPAALALEQVGQAPERPHPGTLHGLAAGAVVKHRVHRLLEHPLLVAEDDFRGLEVEQAAEPVVPVDDPAVEIVEIARGEAPAFERDERAQVRRKHREHPEDHPLRLVVVAGQPEGLDLLQPLHVLLAPGRRGLVGYAGAEGRGQLVEIELLEQQLDRVGAHVDLEDVTVGFAGDPVLLLGQHGAGRKGGMLGLDDHVGLVIDDSLEVHVGDVEELGYLAGLEVPDVGDGHGQLDVPHPLAPHAGVCHLDAAPVALHTAVTDPLVLAATAFPVLDRAEDPLAEQAVGLGLEGPVIDGLGLGHLAVGPAPDLLGRGQAYLDPAEVGGECPRVPHGNGLEHSYFSSSATSSTSRARLLISLSSTLKDSGTPGSGMFSLFTTAL